MSRQLGGHSRVYVHDESGEVRFYDPGDDVPAWAAKQITNPNAWGDADDEATASDAGDVDNDEVKPYAKWKKADLESEVESRNEGREDDDLIVVGGTGKVADLAAALDADDEATASDAGDNE